jgi:ectoine hydroxylase-related dioxygenase (phytanoyl-CoA dioxygenase family)
MLEAEPIFASLYKGEALHTAARQVIGGPFKLSCFHARTLHRVCDMGEFHIDFRPDEQPFPLLSFIFMIDEFSERNGATRFVAGSQRGKDRPSPGQQEECVMQSVPACGPAGSVIIFDGRVWHAHGANSNSLERRSLQGSFIPTAEMAAMEFDIPTFD